MHGKYVESHHVTHVMHDSGGMFRVTACTGNMSRAIMSRMSCTTPVACFVSHTHTHHATI